MKSQRFLLLVIVLAVFIANVIATYTYLTKPHPGHNDFYSRWEGARSYWREGLNPYGAEASLNIQMGIYGQAATEVQDPGYFAYPFYTVFLLLPIVYTSYAWASAIWMVTLEACLIGALLLLIQQFQWRPAPLLLASLFLWTVISYFPARGLILGQAGLMVYFLEVLTLWALVQNRKVGYEVLAGFALALSTIKPQMGYLFVPLVLLWGLREKRWYFIGGFTGSFLVLMLASFLLQPSWLSDWLGQVSIYSSYTQIGSPVWVLANGLWLGIDPSTGLWTVFGGYGQQIEWLLLGILYLYMLWTWYGVLIQGKRERFLWTVVMTLTITHLAAPRTASPHFVVFIIPLIFYLRELSSRKRGTVYALLLLIALFILQWAHFFYTVSGEFEHPTIYLPTPLIIFALLIFTRHWWWTDKRDKFQLGQVA